MLEKKIKFFNNNKLEKIICLGFGKQLIDIAQFCKKNSLDFDWYTGKRQYYNNNQYSDYISLLNNVDLEKINSFQLKAKYEQLPIVN